MRKPKDVIAIYDDGSNEDRYTVVLDRKQWEANPRRWTMLGFNANPEHPSFGISQLCEGVMGSHLGKRIAFANLPLALQAHVIRRVQHS